LSVVLDASALLALLRDEEGAAMVAEALEQGGVLMSAVNWAETLSRLSDYGQDLDGFVEYADVLVLEPFDQIQAEASARLRVTTRKAGLSLGDRACLALAKTRGLAVLTADRGWTGVALGVEIRLIRS